MNNKGAKGSPCLRPLELGKRLDASPLIKIEKRTVEMQDPIPPVSRKTYLFKNNQTKTPRGMIISLLNIKLTKNT